MHYSVLSYPRDYEAPLGIGPVQHATVHLFPTHRNCTVDGASRTSQRGYRRLRFAHDLLNEPYVTSTVPDIAGFLDDLGLALGSSFVRYKTASKNPPQQLWAAAVDRLLSVTPGVDGVRTDQPRMLNPEEEELQPLWNAVVSELIVDA